MRELRKPAAKYSKHKFLTKWNDIIFFIEDKDSSTKKIYREMLIKTFKEKSIDNVFPLGGRIEVVNQCRKSMYERKKEKAIYIIDGDLYMLAGENEDIFGKLDELKNLFILPRYCVENFLIEEPSLVLLLDEEDLEKNETELEELLAFEDWISFNENLFKKLYLIYAIAHKIGLGVPTVNYSISKLVSSGDGTLDVNKVEERFNELENLIIEKIGEENYIANKKEVMEKIPEEGFLLKYVSGKDHLLPLLKKRMDRITKINCTNDTYKLRLAKKNFFQDFNSIVDFYNELYA